jgi:hypothetical protein
MAAAPFTSAHLAKPLSDRTLLRLAVVVIVALALAAAYFHSVLDVYKMRYSRLELKLIKAQADLAKPLDNQ